ncbi:hypothetical protein ANT_16490 [Candidatus Moduliflexus flocculans]|uniref:DUF1257 domain-containing protein n=1 Tax=Candidatus Moduliflexus flocculans TaxID=1499966 RepID=A0A081BMJ9_9BACT|nr:hypothetical protein ANT_16490 [Candidatus Moduliflexus flocculans]
MSHFSRIRTKMVEKEFLLQALKDEGFEYEVGEHLQAKGYAGKKADVEIRLKSKKLLSYDIGFKKSGDAYECVADWYGVKGIDHKEFISKLQQRYAYHATRAKLAEQGFDLVEETHEGNRIHLRLRRMA